MNENEEFIEFLRKSREQIGELEPVIMTEDGRVIDGKHRLKAYPGWRKVIVNKSPKEALKERIHRTLKARVTRKERQAQILEYALYLEEEGVKPEEMVSALAKELPFSEDYLRKLLPAKYKNKERREAALKRHERFAGLNPAKIGNNDAKIVTSSESLDERPDMDRDIAEDVVSENVKWILDNSTSDVNYKATIPRLSDAELEYCLKYETRESGRRQLLSELERRKGTVKPKPKSVKTLTCPGCHVEIRTVYCTKCFSELEVREIAKILKKEMLEASE